MTRKQTHRIRIVIAALAAAIPLLLSAVALAELVMQTQGYASFAPYVHGIREEVGLKPGYRAEFLSQVDFFRYKGLVVSGIVGNMTIISRSDSIVFNLDRLRYTLSPVVRYEFDRWFLKAMLHHESLYSISRAEDSKGAYWQNSFRIGAGTKSSSYLYLPEKYDSGGAVLGGSFDAQVTVGAFFHGSESVWSAKNHDYRYEMQSLLRYHAGSVFSWIFSTSLYQQLWRKADATSESKTSLTVNAYKKGSGRLFGIYYSYVIHDSYAENNEDGLGALGVRLVY